MVQKNVPLANTNWIVNLFVDENSEVGMGLNLENDPTLLLNEDGTFQVFTSCKEGQGSYAVEANEIQFSGVFFDTGDCNEVEAMADEWIQSVVRDGRANYSIKGNVLRIEQGGMEIRAQAEW